MKFYNMMAAYENGQEIFRRESITAAVDRIKELEAVNADLLAACEKLMEWCNADGWPKLTDELVTAVKLSQAAIARARGEA